MPIKYYFGKHNCMWYLWLAIIKIHLVLDTLFNAFHVAIIDKWRIADPEKASETVVNHYEGCHNDVDAADILWIIAAFGRRK